MKLWSEMQSIGNDEAMVIFMEHNGQPYNCAFAANLKSRRKFEEALQGAISSLLDHVYDPPTMKDMAAEKIEELERELEAAKKIYASL